MSETEKYTIKENAKSDLQAALAAYIKSAEGFGQDDCEMAAELEDLIFDCGKKWDVVVCSE